MDVQEGFIVQAPGGQGKGVVRYVGTTKFKEGIWVGLELDEPKGKNNGEVQGHKYFSCATNHGLFVRLQDIPKDNISNPNIEPTLASTIPIAPEILPPSPIISTEPTSTSTYDISDQTQPEDGAEDGDTIDVDIDLGDDEEEEEVEEPPIPSILVLPTQPSSSSLQPMPAALVTSNEADKVELLALKARVEELEGFKARVEELEESLEMVSLDKEIAEERIEELEQRLTESSKSEQSYKNIAQASNIAVSQQQYNELKAQNEELRTTLATLRDLSVSEHAAFVTTSEEYAKTKKELEELMQDAEAMRQTLEDQAKQMEEMEQAVDDASTAQQIVDQLTEKCLKLEEEIFELKVSLEDSAALNKLSEEVEEQHMDVERILRSQIQELEAAAATQEAKVTNLQERFQDSMRTVEQFRVLVQAQQEKLAAHEQKEGELSEKASVLMAESRILMDQNIQLQAKTHKMRQNAIEAELLKLDQSQARDNLETLLAMIPTSFLSADSAPHHLTLLLKRIVFKCNLVDTTLRREAGISEENAARSEGCACMGKVAFMAKLLMFYMEHYSHELYLRAGQSIGEIVVVERALNAAIAQLSHRDVTPSLSVFEEQCAPSIVQSAQRMEAAISGVLVGDAGYPLEPVLALSGQVTYLHHMSNHILAAATNSNVEAQRTTAELYTLQGVWVKITRCMENGVREIDELGSLERICASGRSILERLVGEGLEGGAPWLGDAVQTLYSDVATLVDAVTLKIPPIQDNSKKSIERVRNTLSEAAGVAQKLADAIQREKAQQDILAVAQASLDEVRRELREKEYDLQQKASMEDQMRQKDSTDKETRLKAYDEQIESLQRVLDHTSAELTKSKTRTQYLEGKVRELMEISGKQKKQLQQQQQLLGITPAPATPEPPQSPRIVTSVSDEDKYVYTTALKHLHLKNARLQAKLAAATIPRLPQHAQVQEHDVPSDPVQALSILAQLPPLPPRPIPRDMQAMHAASSRDPQLPRQINAWLKTSLCALADVRVVDLDATQRGKAEKGGSTSTLNALYKTGAQLRVRACDVLTPRRFHEDTPMGHFTPTHVTKMAMQNDFTRLGTLTLPDGQPSAYYPDNTFASHITLDQWRSVHASFCS